MASPHPQRTAEQILQELLPGFGLEPASSADWMRALEAAIDEQLSDYGRLLLPSLGLGERTELGDRRFRLGERLWSQPEGELWYFDGRYPQSWIQAALLHPFEKLDNWLALVPRAALSTQIARAISPPLIPRLGPTLCALDWVVADFGGHEGGRLKREEFFVLLGDHPWFRVEHYADRQVVHLQQWQGRQIVERWRCNIEETFGCALPEEDTLSAPGPLALPQGLLLDVGSRPLEAAVLLDVLGDPYATLRRYVWQRFALDLEQLGPQLLWRDFPDELFEFDDRHESSVADISFTVADELALDAERVRPVLEAWFALIAEATPIELPVIGTLHSTVIPELSLNSPLASEDGAPQSIGGRRMHVASARPAHLWFQDITILGRVGR
ncbi:MAG: hypothetical protein H0U74_23895 [Bradymonadaceae bacterium]|nr:hypothetical protein [Lujinxingiaceae bacterium]